MNKSFNDLVLTREESRTLRKIARHGKYSEDKIDYSVFNTLYVNGLIDYNYHDNITNDFGERIHDGTVRVTVDYERYKRYRFNKFIENKVPIIISIIALISSFREEILSLIQAIMKLLK